VEVAELNAVLLIICECIFDLLLPFLYI